MNIDVEAFGIYLILGVVIIGFIWAVWPLFRKDKVEEKQEPEPFIVPPPVAEIKPAPVPSLEPVVAPEPAREEIKADIDAKTEEAFVKAMETEAKAKPTRAKKAPAKKPAATKGKGKK